MTITHRTCALALATLLASASPVFAAGIPVIDTTSMAARAAEHIESIAKYMEQIATLKAQLESAQRQYAALTGTRNLGDILNNPAIRNSLPTDVKDILSSTGASYASIQSSVERIKDEERLTGDFTIDNQALSRRVENLALRSKALFEQAQQGMQTRLSQLDQLQNQINLTTDPKAIGELQARLQIEQANIQADQMRADLLSRQLAVEKALIQEQSSRLVKQASFSLEAIHAPLPDMR